MISSATVEVHAGQDKVLTEAKRYNTLACGRRWGKTMIAEYLLVEKSGLGYPVGLFTPTYKLLEETYDNLAANLGGLLAFQNKQSRKLTLKTGGSIEMWSLDSPDAGRSRKYARAVIDEAGMVPNLGKIFHNAIRPTLADYEGDAWFLGTPQGRNFFWETFNLGQDAFHPDWASWQMPTSCNPWIKPGEIEAMRESMTERSYRQEILAEFLEDGGGVFRGVRGCSTAVPQTKAILGHAYSIGVDWARSGDFSVFAVIDVTTGECCHLERMTGVEYAHQQIRLTALWEAFGRPPVLAEANSMGGPVIEALQRTGMWVSPFTTTNQSKAQVIDALVLAFERGQLRIVPDPVLIAELEAFESERLPSGLLRYGAPEGQHDDTVIALCLANWGATRNRTEVYG